MKNFFRFALAAFFLSSISFAQALPPSVDFTLEAVNISHENKNAEQLGARPGDVVRYELTLYSETENIIDYTSQVNVAQVLETSEIIDTGLGVLQGNMLVYPAVNKSAPCTHTFSFFARVKPDCGSFESVSLSWEGQSVNVPLHCSLTPTGPASNGTFAFALIAGIAILISLAFNRKSVAS
ncbi:hypothetical protein K9M59_03695 [Candidatus Gracilibacteria bacterium]|nr:hypothetical protein [Candidatus Gracilibacteria bacterium]MCF7819426.1 hypothetical protein [Candidatus Gracilibacteria bacterium]